MKAEKHPTGVLIVLLLSGVTFALSQTLVIPSLSEIGKSVGAGPAASSWILTGFLLSASVSTPIVGKLGDIYGKGRVLTAVLLLFSFGAVLCALGNSIVVLIVGRVIQGVAGGVFPLAFGIIRDTFPPERVPSGLGLMSAIIGIGAGFGLPLSGIIVDNFDLSLLFWTGLIALPAAFAAHRLIPESPTARRTPIDWGGAALLSMALASLLLGVTEANRWGWISAGTLGLIVGGLITAAVWVRFEARHPDPLIDVSVLSDRVVAATNATGLLIGFALFASFLLIPQFAQADSGFGFNYSVTQSGLLLLPTAVCQLIAGPVAGRIGARVGFRTTLIMGASFATLSFGVLAFEHAHAWELAVAGGLLGTGISFGFASMANLIVAAVPQEDVGIATGINTVMRTIGGAFGAGIATAILAAHTIGASDIPSEHGYTLAFLLSAVGGLLALAAALAVPRSTSARAAGRV